MLINREGLNFVLSLAFASLAASFVLPFFSAILFLFTCFTAFFFRDPLRRISPDPSELVSPADGHVISVDRVFEPDFFGSEVQRVSIFLSVFDVHVNRSPLEGNITYTRYREGKFLAAFNEKASQDNERNSFGIEGNGRKVMVVQIAGLIARRIVCWKGLGDSVAKGGKIGMIKFGSRTDLLFPDDFEVSVRKGQRVRGGLDVIAKIRE